ncbi:glycoside hydrolase family 17 protein [Dothidotthia symphoricarpi CBS 119687]|uniref:Glycoside hydrolase family 17 protein n=1 Tax=Dothidotthia symphoricarpi CBS 119687 TaxID=1392245 RepID=A0A6A6AEU4_9PLEO|nr:glycoside hydrolase family 17 protein [Dothidotthia symphoricarpi CBS 119687]KAF2129833.1 glycoside hydrolase family 17 protein [Dothidotthia symphoricarpi CBS 119687]
MKNVALASALAAGFLIGTVGGHPFKRAVVTEVVYVTETIGDAVVYVDEKGVPYSTTTINKITSVATAVVATSTTSSISLMTPEMPSAPEVPSSSATSAPSALPSFVFVSEEPEPTRADIDVPEASNSQFYEPPIITSVAVESAYVPLPSLAPAPEPEPSAIKQDDSAGRLPIGVTYDPFTGTGDNSRCKTEQEITSEFNRMKDYKIVRIYGMGCNIIPLAVQNALRNGQTLMAGVYLSNRGNGEALGQVIQTFKDAIDQYAGGSWDIVRLFAVENERVNEHDMTASDVVGAIHSARGQLRGLGYNGPVGAVETVPATIDNPAICQASDVVMVNCHAFFDPNTKAADAGAFVQSQIELVKTSCNTNRVVVTESGWPHQGDANGAAVPSPENQRIALESIRGHFDHDMFLHNAFDSTWKSDWASSFNAERWWGVIQ